MSLANDHLGEIHRQIDESFAAHRYISAVPSKGQPPDQYTITYAIAGLHKTEQGEIATRQGHTVELAIPFGFPHFPPSCKPKTEIFHPDFDPAAICLGNFWETNPSLVDLIIHIGRMINGEAFTTTNAFNEEAAEWYSQNREKFPLALIAWGSSSAHGSLPAGSRGEIDTLDDADLADEFDYLSLEVDEEEEAATDTVFPEVSANPAIDFDQLRLLKKKRHYYALFELTRDLLETSGVAGGAARQARDEIQRAEKLHRRGKEQEEEGKADQAQRLYQEIFATVTDFPGIEADIRRMKQAAALLQELSPTAFPADSTFSDEEIALELDAMPASPGSRRRGTDPGGKKRREQHSDATRSPGEAAHHPPPASRERGRRSLLPLLAFLLIIAAGAGGAYLYFSLLNQLQGAEEAYTACDTALAAGDFAAAEASCRQADQLLATIPLLQRARVKELRAAVSEILQSEQLNQGVAGMVLVNGRYLPKTQATFLTRLQQEMAAADVLFQQERWPEASEQYRLLASEASQNGSVAVELVELMQSRHHTAEFMTIWGNALESVAQKQWSQASARIGQAKGLLVTLPATEQRRHAEKLADLEQRWRFAESFERAEKLFAEADWQSAAAVYRQAQALAANTPGISKENLAAIEERLQRAEIYTTIAEGNMAFAEGAWIGAITAYQQAADLLEKHQNILSSTDSVASRNKLGRIILQAAIIKNRQDAANALQNNDLQAARQSYQSILASIDGSNYARDDEFVATKAELTAALEDLGVRIFLAEKESYLIERFRELFVAHYPNTVAENLINPQVSLSKETAAQIIFRMQCTEAGQGRPLTLVMFYAYDKTQGSWSLHTENSP